MSGLKNLNVIIMAAGKGKRMRSKTPKVLHKILDEPLIFYVLTCAKKIGPKNIYVVLGHEKEKVQQYVRGHFSEVIFATQQEQLGTAHAVQCVLDSLDRQAQDTLILSADTPLLDAKTLEAFIGFHSNRQADASLLSAKIDDPFGYGRIIRDEDGHVKKIVEEADADEEQRKNKEVNTSIYCFKTTLLFEYIARIRPDNKQNEYYLTDIIEHFLQDSLDVRTFQALQSHEVMGINDRVQLAAAEKTMQEQINQGWMVQGVTIRDIDSVYIGPRSVIGPDTVIEPHTSICGESSIGKDCMLGPSVQIKGSRIGEGTVIEHARVMQSTIGPFNHIGPYSVVGPETLTSEHVDIGSFCTVKNTALQKGTIITREDGGRDGDP